MTDAERKLWFRLKDIALPKSHFRKQAPIGPYFADFVCHDAKLVIELDGEQHATPDHAKKDTARTKLFLSKGYSVLRFWNHEILGDIESALDTIHAALTDQNFVCDTLSHPLSTQIPGSNPLPQGESV